MKMVAKKYIAFLLIIVGVTTLLFLNTQPEKKLPPQITPEKPTATSSTTTLPTKITPKKEIPKVASTSIIAPIKTTPEIPKSIPATTFIEDFNTTYSVIEADKSIDSTSPGWWLGSGAHFYSANGIGSTSLGPLKENDPLRKEYSISNPIDTDNGYYPQNIFRLVLIRHKWKDFQQEMHFKIINTNLSNSPNRNVSNGILFFNRYQDANNLYYTGIRVDGAAVIKKKIKGVYYELSINQFYKDSIYNHETNPNLIPEQKWFGLRSNIITNSDNTVTIKLYIDKDNTGNWILATQATDDGRSYGGEPILDEGYAGIRTDFMDAEFDNYKIIQN